MHAYVQFYQDLSITKRAVDHYERALATRIELHDKVCRHICLY